MGFERNYQVKIPTNQLKNINFSTLSSYNKINPWFITGFSDAEASFIISIYKYKNSKMKWRVSPNFSIHLHIRDIALLKNISKTLGVGKVRKNSNSTAIFRVDNIQEIQVIVDHFDKYPLISTKLSNFLIFKQCYDLIKQKEHLTQKGLEEIIALKCNLNKGLTASIIEAFPNIKYISRPGYLFMGIPDPFWISGFVSGDSSFYASIEKSRTKRSRVRLVFGTCLHIKDKAILICIRNYFNILEVSKEFGIDLNDNLFLGKYIYDSMKRKTSLLQIRNNFYVINKIIPFFNKYPILGVKSLDFAYFKEVAELVKNRKHLTESGLKKNRENSRKNELI